MTSSIKEGKARPMPEQYKKEETKPPTPVEDKLVEEKDLSKTATEIINEQKKAETIEIPKTEWEEMKKNMEVMKSKGEFLETIADKKAKALYYLRHKDKLPIHVKLSTWPTEDGDKVVVGWKMLIDQGEYRDPQTGRRVEKQIIEITLEDDKKVELPYLTWVEQYGQTNCEQTGTETDEGGNMKLKLKKLDDGKVYVVDVVYVN